MTDRRRYNDMSDDELESLLRGLPARAPSDGLRARVLSYGLRARRPRPHTLRPVLAFAALILLLVADLLVLHVQDTSLSADAGASPAVVTAQAPLQDDESVAWLRELGVSGLGLRVARLSADSETRPQTRAELLRSLLTPGNGG